MGITYIHDPGSASHGNVLDNVDCPHLCDSEIGLEQTQRWTDVPIYLVLPTIALALIVALFHLGKVVHIIGAAPNLGSSSMS